jgi:4a-hydroxytetrahydrobiopterin dehydratase
VRREKLTSTELSTELSELKGWEPKGDTIAKRFEFKDFADSLTFVNSVGALAESADHHPDITFGWGYAEIALTTHDRGGVTDVDIALARSIQDLS